MQRVSQLLSNRYFDLSSFLKFTVLVLLFNAFHYAYIGITAPGGNLYSPFLDEHLNYVNWIGHSIMQCAYYLSVACGVELSFESPTLLALANGQNVAMGYSCLGLQLMGCWIAFLIIQTMKVKTKIAYALAGIVFIMLLNILRVTFLILSLWYRWPELGFLDHHSLYNLVAYGLLLGGVVWVSKVNTKSLQVKEIAKG